MARRAGRATGNVNSVRLQHDGRLKTSALDSVLVPVGWVVHLPSSSDALPGKARPAASRMGKIVG
jgi:hypothetical protein